MTTDLQGVLRYRLRVRRDVEVYAAYPGGSTTAASRSRTVGYTVAPVLRLRVTRHRITAVVRPAAGQLLRLQQWSGRRWMYVEGRRANAHGRAVFTRLP